MHGDLIWEVGILCGQASAYRAGCTIDVALVPSQPKTSFRLAITNDFCRGGQGSWCTYEGWVVPVKECCPEARDVLYFFMYVVHEEGKKGVG